MLKMIIFLSAELNVFILNIERIIKKAEVDLIISCTEICFYNYSDNVLFGIRLK